MKFYLGGLGNWANDYKQVEKAILKADDLGFDGALIPDHYQWGAAPFLKRPDRDATLESWIALTYLAGKTKQIKLGTLVTPIPFRPPGILAKMVSTLDVLSGGRVVFGVGAGWSQTEFEGYSTWDEPKVRVDKTTEGLKLMIKLWTQDKVTHKGKHYKAKEAVLEPKPIQKPYPKLLFGGVGKRMLRLAGRHADICYLPQFGPNPGKETMRQTVQEAAKRANRTEKITFMGGEMHMMVPAYDPKVYAELVQKAKDAGDQYYLLSLPRTKDHYKALTSFGKDIIPSFQ